MPVILKTYYLYTGYTFNPWISRRNTSLKTLFYSAKIEVVIFSVSSSLCPPALLLGLYRSKCYRSHSTVCHLSPLIRLAIHMYVRMCSHPGFIHGGGGGIIFIYKNSEAFQVVTYLHRQKLQKKCLIFFGSLHIAQLYINNKKFWTNNTNEKMLGGIL